MARKHYLLTALLVTLSLLFAACGDDESKTETTFVAYNAGLAVGFVDNAEARQPAVISAMQSIDADVICLQEVWSDESRQAVIDGMSAEYPFNHFEVTTNEEAPLGPPPCGDNELDDLFACANDAMCSTDPELVSCVLDNCGEEFQDINAECTQCVSANVNPDFDSIRDTCTMEARLGWVYEGRNGLLILSKHPFLETDVLRMDSCLTRRVALYASVDGEAGVDNVFCTHLSAQLSDTENTCGQYPDWASENLAQVQELESWVQDKAGDESAVIIGDFNTGPELGEIAAELPDSYNAMANAGWVSPYVTDTGFCTFCADENTLIDDMEPGKIIDHVFLRNMSSSVAENAETRRFLDQQVMIDIMGTMESSNLSDHFAVEVKIER